MATAATGKTRVGGGGYEVARPQGVCKLCNQPIAPGEKFIAALRETPEGFERLDISPQCWEGFDRKDLLGFWQTVMPRPEEKKKLFVDDEVLCGLFERLAEAVEPVKVNFRFVLGLILMRKRLLLYEGTRSENGRDYWSVRLRGREQTMDLFDPHLDEQQVAEVSGQLSEILNEEI